MINANELKAAIVRKGMTQTELAKKLDISPKTFSTRISKGIFGSDEIENMMIVLDIKDPMPIFFASLVS